MIRTMLLTRNVATAAKSNELESTLSYQLQCNMEYEIHDPKHKSIQFFIPSCHLTFIFGILK